MEALAFLLVVGGVLFAMGLVALKVVLALVLLPFKLIAGLLKVVLGVVAGLFGLLFSGVAVVGVLLALLFGLVLLPLLPFLAIGVSSGWPRGRGARMPSVASPDQRAATRLRARRSSGRSGRPSPRASPLPRTRRAPPPRSPMLGDQGKEEVGARVVAVVSCICRR